MMLFFALFLSFIAPAFSTVSNFLSWAPRLAWARLLAKWRSLLTIIIGVILGAGIGALIPLYSNAVGQIGMVQRLEDEPLADAHAQMRISLKPTQIANLDGQVDFVAEFVEESVARHISGDTLDSWVREINPYIKTSKMGVLNSEGEVLESTRTSILYLSNWEKHVRVVQGELPDEMPVPEGADFNIAVPLFVANELDIAAGDFLIVDQRLDNSGRQNVGAHESSRPFTVHVAAIVAPQDERDPFWMTLDAQEDPLMIRDGGLWRREINFLATEATARTVMLDYVPATDTTFGWRVIFNHDNLSYTDIDDARIALRNLEAELFDSLSRNIDTDLGYRYHTRLISYGITNSDNDQGILQDYDKKQKVNNVPFALLLIQVGGLVIFFLTVTAALVRRGERREIAMFQSRGALDGHIIALRGIEAVIICIFGALIAPFLAQRLLILLGPSIANTSDFPLPLTRYVFLYSFIASVLTFGALILTMIPVLKLPLISAGGSALRSDKVSWFQKYYVDIVLSVAGLLLIGMLLRRDSPLIPTNLGEQRVDYFLLAAPILLMFGVGSVALRVFPFIASGIAQFTNRGRSLMSALASWQLSREPLHYGRVTFLLALAISIGWFATSFRATVSRSQADQARYIVGTDARIYERDTALQADRARSEAFYEDHADIEAASLARRITNISFVSSRGLQPVDLLAVDPRSFGDVTLDSWRGDLGNIRVPYTPDANVSVPQVGQVLPFAPTKIGMWARFDRLVNPFAAGSAYQPDLARLANNMTLHVRLQDENGVWVVVEFEAIRAEYLRQGEDLPGFGSAAHVTSGWVYYEADFSTLSYQMQGEVRLVSIFWEHRTTSNNGERRLRLLLADVSLLDAEGNVTAWDGLLSNDWSFVQDAGAETLVNADDIRPGIQGDDIGTLRTQVLSITFDQFALWSRMGINLSYPRLPALEAIVSNTMSDAIGLPTAEEARQLIADAEADADRIIELAEEEAAESDNPDEVMRRAEQNAAALVETARATTQATFTLDNVNRVSITLHTTSDSVTQYFPSLFDNQRAFVVVDLRELMYAINERPSATYYPDEVWLQFTEDVETKAEVATVLDDLEGGDNSGVTRIDEVTYANEFDTLETDPLALGLLGLMFLAFIIALALSIVGLLTYAALTAQARRGEFGVLRALGLASRRVVFGLLLEQLFVVLVASVLGAALGYVLSTAVMPTLALGTTGEGVVPPFITETEWSAVANFALIMVAVLAGVFAFSFLLVRQLSLSRTLRLGDE